MPAALLGPVIGAGISTAGSLIAGGKAGAGAAQAQAALQQQRNDLAPWRGAGGQALGAQTDLLGLNGQPAADAAMANFQQGPGYQFTLGQGLRAVDAGAAASGMLRSGAALQAEQTFGSGLANQTFQQYYNNLAGISQLGENAATGGATTANTAGALAQGAGNTQGTIYGNAAQGLTNSTNNLLNSNAVQNWLNGPSPTPISSGNPNLIWNPNNPVGTESLGGSTANNGWFANNF